MRHPRLAAHAFIAGALAAADYPDSTEKLKRKLRSGELAWEMVIDLANRHLVSPALWSSLDRRGLTDYLPQLARDYLQEMHRLNMRRNARLKEQVTEAGAAFNQAGIEPVLLKGAAHLFTDLFGDPGARLMTDVDIFVEKGDFDTALSILRKLGYQEYGEIKNRHPPLFRPGDYSTIELHRELVDRIAFPMLPASEGLAATRPMDTGGLRYKILSPTLKVLHNILHSEVVNRYHARGVLSLRSLHDLSFLQKEFGDSVDWGYIRRKMDSHGKGRVLRDYLYLGQQFFNMPLPQEIELGWREKWHARRCCARIIWGWWAAIEEGLEKFSAENICDIYNCDDAILPVMAGRFRYAGYLAAKCSRMGWKKVMASGTPR